MSAKVNLNAWGTWVGVCTECHQTIAGAKSTVHLWADVHNQDFHCEKHVACIEGATPFVYSDPTE